jgi:hypothetical protein
MKPKVHGPHILHLPMDMIRLIIVYMMHVSKACTLIIWLWYMLFFIL